MVILFEVFDDLLQIRVVTLVEEQTTSPDLDVFLLVGFLVEVVQNHVLRVLLLTPKLVDNSIVVWVILLQLFLLLPDCFLYFRGVFLQEFHVVENTVHQVVDLLNMLLNELIQTLVLLSCVSLLNNLVTND